MIKKIFIVGISPYSLTHLYANEVLAQTVQNSSVVFSLEWIALILLSLIGFTFIYKSARQIKKIKTLQKELDTYHVTVSDELHTLGGENA